VKILVADDHAMFLEAFSDALSSRGHEVVAMVTDVTHVLTAVRRTRPSICVLDINFPDGNGIRAAQRIIEEGLCDRVVMLTETTDADSVAQAMRAGARGFTRKTQSVDVIVRLLERVAAGEIVIDREGFPLQAPRRMMGHDAKALSYLTHRETDVLHCLVAGQSTDELARSLGISSNTARTHVQNVLTKLGVNNRLQAVMLLSRAQGHVPSEVATT
jgi:DNA-binding NarL/FixJ family response regulator